MPNQRPVTQNNTPHPHHSLSATKALWIFFSLFIVYGVLIPFQLCENKAAVLSNIANISWIPLMDNDGTRASIPDIVQNILLFLPFGFFGFLSLHPEKKFRIIRITLLGAVFSLCVEILQLFTIDRTSSVTDIVTNTAGTFLGALTACIAALIFSTFISSDYVQRYCHTDSFFPLLVACALVVLGTLQPFDFTLDVGSVWSKVKALIHHPLVFDPILKDELVVFLRFVLLAYVCALFFQEHSQESLESSGVY